ncbi:hypothetical protein Msi02_79790 [Microbispora siamensis]|uniref:DUF4158 domain-containing protein n=1 Tax=Microbispora siamensis TaxID=564413 RepID=A0ABQ4H0G4_9ACTN|nr:hypothetical protein Msi02_79790 [Microbispora siamensis]
MVGFVAEQLGVDPEEFADYGRRAQTVYEHAWEIRELPGITVLTRLVGEVRREENARPYGLLAERTPAETAVALRGLLKVPEDRRVSELERLRTSPVKASGRVLVRGAGPGRRDRRAGCGAGGGRAGSGGEAGGAGAVRDGVQGPDAAGP